MSRVHLLVCPGQGLPLLFTFTRKELVVQEPPLQVLGPGSSLLTAPLLHAVVVGLTHKLSLGGHGSGQGTHMSAVSAVGLFF